MFPVRACSLAALWFLLLCASPTGTAHAVEKWPAGSAVDPESKSPDGRYGVLLPKKGDPDTIEAATVKNTLVDLRSHRRIAVIDGAHYMPGQIHNELHATWAPDSSWCAVVYDARWGFENITLVEPHGAKCTQTDLGGHIQKVLTDEINRQASEKTDCYGTVHFRPGPGGTVLVRAYAEAHPRKLDDEDDFRAVFQGTFDRANGRWAYAEALKIQHTEPFEIAYTSALDETLTFTKDEDRLNWFNGQLKLLLEAVQTVLPKDRFAAMEEQQAAWSKQLEAVGSAGEKCQRIAARIRELRDLMW